MFQVQPNQTPTELLPESLRSEKQSALLHVWSSWVFSKGILSGKWKQGICAGQQMSPQVNSPFKSTVTVASVWSKAVVIKGHSGAVLTNMMVNSGLSIFVVQAKLLNQSEGVSQLLTAPQLQLVTASGEPLKVLNHVRAAVVTGQLSVLHEFLVVNTLVAPVIHGIDFFQKHHNDT